MPKGSPIRRLDDVVPSLHGRSAEGREFDATLASARLAWSQAGYDEVVRELSGRSAPEARILLARTLLRLREFAAVGEVLRGATFEDPDDAGSAAILRAAAAERADATGATRFTPQLPAEAGPLVRAAAEYYAALSAWTHGDLAGAIAHAERAVDRGDADVRALGTELQAWIEASNHRPATAIAKFLETLDNLGGAYRDEYVRANTLRGLAFFACGSFDVAVLPRLVAESATLRPTAAIARSCISAQQSIARLHALVGDDAACYETLLGARAVEAPEPFAALIDVALAEFLQRRGNTDAAALHRDIAFRRLESAAWSAADLEARLVPVLFAFESAAAGDPRAGRALTKALSVAGKRDPILAFEHDARAAAFALFARGRIAASRGKSEVAVADIRKAVAFWQRCGDRLMFCEGSLELMRIEGESAPSRALAAELHEIPRSWLSKEAERLAAPSKSPRAQLTPAEARVLDKICEGLTSRQISKTLGRSPSTVRNQTISIFRKLDVNTRAALVARVMDSGARRG